MIIILILEACIQQKSRIIDLFYKCLTQKPEMRIDRKKIILQELRNKQYKIK